MAATTKGTPPQHEEEVFAPIRWLTAGLRFLEDLITAISGYGIVFALGVGAMDLFTDGQLTADISWINFVYGFALAAGIAGQIIGLASRSNRAFQNGERLAGCAYMLLVLLLAFVEYEAAVVYGFHKVFNKSVVDSLNDVGISQSGFIQLRSGTAVALAVISGFLRYQPKQRKSAEEVEHEEEYKRRVAAAKTATQSARLAGWVQSTKAAVNQATGKKEEIVPGSTVEEITLDGDSDAESTPEKPKIEPWRVPGEYWDAQTLQAWVETYGFAVTIERARGFLKIAGDETRMAAAGSPWVALPKDAQAIARKRLKLPSKPQPLKVANVIPFGREDAVNS